MDLDFGFLIKKDGGEKLKEYSLHSRISLYAQTIFVRFVIVVAPFPLSFERKNSIFKSRHELIRILDSRVKLPLAPTDL